ncbi:MAG: aldo/keto reductase [Chloroflexi bacterium]|nr:aldo/keto reductase [Chloroflexota bacterium]
MRYLQIPGTDITTSVLGLGTASMGTGLNADDSFRLLDAWLERGGTLLDTANAYANWVPGERSLSEKTIGRWLQARCSRQRVVLATKGGNPEVGSLRVRRLAPAEIRSDLEASLRNLQTDTIDLYYLHRDDPQRPVAEIMEELNRAVKAGQVRYLGCSNWGLERIQAAQAYAAEHGLQGFSVNQVLWNAAVCNPEAIRDADVTTMDLAMHRYHLTTGMAAAAFSSQANGYFGKLAAGQETKVNAGTRKMYHSLVNIERLARMRQLAEVTGNTITQIVLGYLLGQPFPVIALVGPQTREQLEDSVSAGDIRLSAAQIAFIEAA